MDANITNTQVNADITQEALSADISQEQLNSDITQEAIAVNITEEAFNINLEVTFDEFTDLTDTPNTYVDNAGKIVVVKSDESGLEFTDDYYTKTEVGTEIDTNIATHTGISDAHHARYTDAEAIAAVAGDDAYVLNAGDTMTGPLQIQVPTTTQEALILQTTDDNATKNLLEVRDQAGVLLANITPIGCFGAPRTAVGTPTYTFHGDPNTGFGNQADDRFNIVAGGNTVMLGSPSFVQLFTSGGVKFSVVDSQGSLISGFGATVIPLRIQLAPSATANAFEVQNSSGGVMADITSDGRLQIGSTVTDYAINIINDVPTTDPTSERGGIISQFRIDSGNDNITRAFYGVNNSILTRTGYTGNHNGGLIAARYEVNHAGTGTVDTAYGGQFEILISTTGILTSGYGSYIKTPSVAGGATLTNFYGLYVQDINTADTLNYAIYTNAGAVRFGDKVMFTQTDGNEYIDSLADGYMDYGATTAHRFNTNLLFVDVANSKVGIGTASPTELLDINSDSIRIRTSKTPASATDTCDQGEMSWDADYMYVCTATNTWKRTPIATW